MVLRTSAEGIILALGLGLLQILQTMFFGWDDFMAILYSRNVNKPTFLCLSLMHG
jgi:hypothetical protein